MYCKYYIIYQIRAHSCRSIADGTRTAKIGQGADGKKSKSAQTIQNVLKSCDVSVEEVVERRKKLVQRSLHGRFEQTAHICTILHCLREIVHVAVLSIVCCRICISSFFSARCLADHCNSMKCNEHWIVESTSTISLRLGLPALHFCSVRATTVFEPLQQGARDAKRSEWVAVCSGTWWFGWHTVMHFMVHSNSLGR